VNKIVVNKKTFTRKLFTTMPLQPDTIDQIKRTYVGLPLRDLAAIFQVAPSALCMALQGTRKRPPGLTEWLAAINTLNADSAMVDLPPINAAKLGLQLKRLMLKAETLRLKEEAAREKLRALQIRIRYLQLLFEIPAIQADADKRLTLEYTLREVGEQYSKALWHHANHEANLRAVEVMIALWEKLRAT
jgi:hypothetical protein